jgi:hypothetical protein
VCCAWSLRLAAEFKVQAATESDWTATGGAAAAGAGAGESTSPPLVQRQRSLHTFGPAAAAAMTEQAAAAAVAAAYADDSEEEGEGAKAGTAGAQEGAAAGGTTPAAAAAGNGARASASAAPVVSIASIAAGEVWFVSNMVMPFWDAVAAVYPPLNPHAQRIRHTVAKYSELVEPAPPPAPAA